MSVIFAKLSAELHRHPKARRAGYDGTNIFRVVLELNALHGATGRIPASHAEPYYLADALMCPEEVAARGLEAAIRAKLLELEPDGTLAIVGWDDDEWGRGARLKTPDSNAERQARYKSKKRLTPKSSDVTGNEAGNGDRYQGNEVTGGNDRLRDQSQIQKKRSEPDQPLAGLPRAGARSHDTAPLSLVPDAPKPARRASSRPLPADWTPDLEHEALARELGLDARAEATKMRDWALGKGERKADWAAAFRNWLRGAAERMARAGPRGAPPWNHNTAGGDLPRLLDDIGRMEREQEAT